MFKLFDYTTKTFQWRKNSLNV